MLTLKTARLQLSPIEASDINELVQLDADPEVVRYVGGQSHSRALYESELMARMMRYSHCNFGYLKASTLDEQKFIGWFHLRPSYFDDVSFELGYRLERKVWGRGFATEGSLALVNHAFSELKAPSVDACASAENTASIRVMEKCGLRYLEERIHPRGQEDVVRYLRRYEG